MQRLTACLARREIVTLLVKCPGERIVGLNIRGSRHLGSRLAVEQALLDAVPESVALRASIVIAARSRSFRFLVRLVERVPVMALPAWRENRTQPIDGRDVLMTQVSHQFRLMTGKEMPIPQIMKIL